MPTKKIRPKCDEKPKAYRTPGPYRVKKPGHGQKTKYLCVQIGSDDSYTTLELEPEDARFIVRACNAHDELLAACEYALKRFEHDGWPLNVQNNAAIEKLREAIARVK